ncbi:thiolase family protein [Nocardioides campestrisoli]|uniref:thiolase family protein n=1 Tax=Nocardioides campestrisoli TaxID=2736757 RepID=UPI00163D9317|nr:thiolase family protein [Nocardioides campestrisoli]
MAAAQACIVGIGTSDEIGADPGRSPMRLQFESLRAALADANLDKSQVNGLVTAWGAPRGVDYDEFAVAAGLDLTWASQLWTHGRWAASTIQQAVMAVTCGLADVVAVINSHVSGAGYAKHLPPMSSSLGGIDEAFRDGGGPYANWTLHGSPGAGAGAAMALQQYMDRYGATSEDLATVPVTLRRYAADNPMALLRDVPLSREEYLAEPVLMGSLRMADVCQMVDASTCLLVTTPERAADLGRPTVTVAGMQGMTGGRDQYVFFSRPGMGAGVGASYDYVAPARARALEMAGLERADLSGFYTYDPFSHMLWMALERWGFCAPGEAASYLSENGFDLDSPLPMNTSGGSLAEGHLYGFGHMLEMVRQLRGEAGPRQIAGATALQWGTPWGDSIVLTNEGTL